MQISSAKHEVGVPATLNAEVAILRKKIIELKNSAAQNRATLDFVREREGISWDVFSRLYENIKEIEEDSLKLAEESITSGDSLAIRFAMGMLEGAVEWLNKPLLPLAD